MNETSELTNILAETAGRLFTDHVTRDGKPKLVETCTFPLTGVGCVTRVYTSLAVVDIVDGHFVLREKLPGMTLEELQDVTGAPLHLEGDRVVRDPDSRLMERFAALGLPTTLFFDPAGAQVNPLKYTRGLAGAAQAAQHL